MSVAEDDPAPLAAPPVVVVVVAHDPGPWFATTLASLAEQDYPLLEIIVIDAASAVAIESSVLAVLPQAVVRRLEHNPGFGAAANEVRALVEGASFYLFCHDDIALEPSTVRLLVEEAYRSNAGVCGPKLVAWDQPDRLLQVGLDVDRRGHVVPDLEPGELDQEQRDAVRDVFVVPGGCQLVRTDLFDAVGGFEPAITFYGEDLDLCWRVHTAGARVLIVPSTRVRHIQQLPQRRADLEVDELVSRHRRLTLRATVGLGHRVRGLPGAIALSVAELLGPLVSLHPSATASAWRALTWPIQQRQVVARRRAEHSRFRHVSDGEVANLQLGSFARLRMAVRSGNRGTDRFGAAAATVQHAADAVRRPGRRTLLAVLAVLTVALVVASRGLIGHGLPAVGEYGRFQRSAWSQLRDYLDGRRPVGVAPTGVPGTGSALLGVWSVLCGGALGLARTTSVLLPVLIGWLGMARLSREALGGVASARNRAVAVVVYAANPMVWNALGAGHWGAVVAFGAMPWALYPVVVAWRTGQLTPPTVALGGIAAAVAAAFEPLSLGGFAIAVAALAIFGGFRRFASVAGSGLTVTGIAVLLDLPWSATVAATGWSPVGGVTTTAPGGLALSDLVRFHTGPIGAGLAGFALVGPVVVTVLWSTGERRRAAIGWMAMGAVSIAAAIVGQHGVANRVWGPSELALVPAAIATALLAAVAEATFQHDIRGRRFGLRQPAAIALLLFGGVALTPALAALPSGRLDLPQRDFDRTLAFLDQSGDARTLWLGDPAALPVGHWWLADGLAWSITDRPRSDVATRWALSPTTSDELVRQSINIAGAGDTIALGRLLGPAGIRYIVVALGRSPAAGGDLATGVPASLTDMLAGQLDLRRIQIDDALVVYENTSWIPIRAMLSPGAADASARKGPAPLALADIAGSRPALQPSARSYRGQVPAGPFYLAAPFDSSWQVRLNGRALTPRVAFGWSSAYDISGGGTLTVSPSASWGRRALVLGQLLMWLTAIAVAIGRRSASASAGVLPDERWPPMEPEPPIESEPSADGALGWAELTDDVAPVTDWADPWIDDPPTEEVLIVEDSP